MSDSKQTTVLVTGASGHLGRHLVPALLDEGFIVRGLDMAAPESPLPDECEFVQMDLSDRDALAEAMKGVDIVVHTASLHPWKPYTDDQYLDANVKGTWTLYSLAAELEIDRVVLTSSIAAIGYCCVPIDESPIVEDSLFQLSDIYSYTKYTQETIARMHADAGNIQTFAMRPPAFMPRPAKDTCLSMVDSFAVVDDIVSAHVAAVRVMSGRQEPGEPVDLFEAFFTVNRLPYTLEKLAEADGDWQQVIKQCWPDAFDWLVANGFTGEHMNAWYDISKAKRVLGWEPAFNFEQAYAALVDSGDA